MCVDNLLSIFVGKASEDMCVYTYECIKNDLKYKNVSCTKNILL